MSLKNFNPELSFLKFEGNIIHPNLSDIVTAYIDKSVFYTHGVSKYIESREIFNNPDYKKNKTVLSSESVSVDAEYTLLLVYLSIMIHRSLSPSFVEHKAFADDIMIKAIRLFNYEHPNASPFLTPNSADIINSHFDFYNKNSFDDNGKFDFSILIENLTPVFLNDLKDNRLSVIDNPAFIHDFSETADTFVLLFNVFSKRFDELYEIINPNNDNFTALIKKSSNNFIIVGQSIDSGLYRIIPSSSTKTQIIIRYTKKNSDSYIEKVLTHKSIIWLRKGVEIKLINCSLQKLIYA